MTMKTKSYSIDDETEAIIKRVADENKFSNSDAVRFIVRQQELTRLFREAQEGFRGVAEELGIVNEDDVERVFG
jgi:hypothetical protein